MKTCPVCGTTYDARVDFCFRDGEVLVKAPAANLQGASSTADLPEDEFDRPLPETQLPVSAPRPPAPSATDLPQPRYLSSATDLPEPAFLQRETVAETAPFPTTPAPAPRAPIPDDETLPMPLDGGILSPPIAPAPESVGEPAFVPPSEPAFTPQPAPLPPVQPAPEPELDAWATPEPPPRMDEDDDGGGAPWGIIALVALLLLSVGGFFAWRSTQTSTDRPIADAGTLPAPPAQPMVEPKPDPVVAPIADPIVDPTVAEVDPVPAPEPSVAPANGNGANGNPTSNPAGNPDRDPEPSVASTEPETTTPAQPWDAPEPADTPQNGTIKINSVPAGAVLFLDGKRLGSAPQSAETSQGRHKVRAEAEGYKTVEIMVSLNGDIANANLTLQRDVKTQQVMLYGPAGAKSVRVAGQTINALPATISLPLGRHVFTVTQADGTSFQVSQSIAEGAQANVMLLPPE